MPSPRVLKLEDVRLDGHHVLAAPIWSFEQRRYCNGAVSGYSPNLELWEKVNEERRRRKAAEQAEREKQQLQLANDDTPMGQHLRKLESLVAMLPRNNRPRGMRVALSPRPDGGVPHCDGSWKVCRVCRSQFMGWGGVKFCKDACAAVRIAATKAKTRAKEKQNPRVRRVCHDPRSCGGCGLPFTPKRADAKYCSVRCRVAQHRREEKLESCNAE